MRVHLNVDEETAIDKINQHLPRRRSWRRFI